MHASMLARQIIYHAYLSSYQGSDYILPAGSWNREQPRLHFWGKAHICEDAPPQQRSPAEST